MEVQAAWHLGQLAKELLEHGFDRVEIEREVRTLELEGGGELDGREVNCATVTATREGGGRQIVALEDVFAWDGLAYRGALAAELRGDALV